MSAYIEWAQKAQAEADEWLAQNYHRIPDAEQRDMARSEGYEYEMLEGDENVGAEALIDSIVLEVAAEEVEAGFWQDSDVEPTAIEHGGIFNVVGLKRWRGRRERTEGSCTVVSTGHLTEIRKRNDGQRISASMERHIKRAAKKRARFGLDCVYDQAGRVRTGRAAEAMKQHRPAVRARKHAIDASMDRAEKVRILAEKAEARKARALKKLARKG